MPSVVVSCVRLSVYSFSVPYTLLLVDGKFNAVRELREAVVQASPQFASSAFVEQLRRLHADRYENFIREHSHYLLFLSMITAYEQLTEMSRNLQLAISTRQPKSEQELLANKIKQVTQTLVDACQELLATTSTLSWLQDDTESYSAELPAGFDTGMLKPCSSTGLILMDASNRRASP